MASTGIQVNGLRQVIRSLEQMGVSVDDLKAAFKKIGDFVTRDAQSIARKKSGAMATSIRPSNTKNKSVVRAGKASVPYAGVQHYGGYNNITPNPFLTDALQRNQGQVVRSLDDELQALIRKYGLN